MQHTREVETAEDIYGFKALIIGSTVLFNIIYAFSKQSLLESASAMY